MPATSQTSHKISMTLNVGSHMPSRMQIPSALYVPLGCLLCTDIAMQATRQVAALYELAVSVGLTGAVGHLGEVTLEGGLEASASDAAHDEGREVGQDSCGDHGVQVLSDARGERRANQESSHRGCQKVYGAGIADHLAAARNCI